MAEGRLIAVVGPSGVGKDTVMEALAAAEPRLFLVRRVITRPSSAGGEVFEGVTEAEFAQREAAGAFALSWGAHELRYGVPHAVSEDLQSGKDGLVNLSRGVLGTANDCFPGLVVLSLTAAPEILASRLAARGRETAADIEKRLSRARIDLPAGLNVVEIANEGPLEKTVDAARAALYPVSA